jgi:hypothetical protein
LDPSRDWRRETGTTADIPQRSALNLAIVIEHRILTAVLRAYVVGTHLA